MSEKEAVSVKAKITNGDIVGLDEVIVATDKNFDAFIRMLKGFHYTSPETVKVIKASRKIS